MLKPPPQPKPAKASSIRLKYFPLSPPYWVIPSILHQASSPFLPSFKNLSATLVFSAFGIRSFRMFHPLPCFPPMNLVWTDLKKEKSFRTKREGSELKNLFHSSPPSVQVSADFFTAPPLIWNEIGSPSHFHPSVPSFLFFTTHTLFSPGWNVGKWWSSPHTSFPLFSNSHGHWRRRKKKVPRT